MNTGRATDERISWTTTGLNFMLPIQESVRSLANITGNNPHKYHSSTQSDSQKISDYFALKFAKPIAELRKRPKFDANFFYDERIADFSSVKPSTSLNDGFSEVFGWVQKYQATILSDFDQMQLEEDTDDEDEEYDSESKDNFANV